MSKAAFREKGSDMAQVAALVREFAKDHTTECSRSDAIDKRFRDKSKLEEARAHERRYMGNMRTYDTKLRVRNKYHKKRRELMTMMSYTDEDIEQAAVSPDPEEYVKKKCVNTM